MPKIIISRELVMSKRIETLRIELKRTKAKAQKLKSDAARAAMSGNDTTPNAVASKDDHKIGEDDDKVPEEAQADKGQSRYWQDSKLVRVDKVDTGLNPWALVEDSVEDFDDSGWWPDPSKRPDSRRTLWEIEHDVETDDTAVKSADGSEYYVDCERCNADNAACEDKTPDSLSKRTRLDDNGFQPGGAVSFLWRINIPFAIQARILRAGLCLAQDTLWHHVRTHWPNAQRSWWYESPRQVRLGRDELQHYFGSGTIMCATDPCDRPGHGKYDYCNQPGFTLTSAIFNLPELRNMVCHQNSTLTYRIDELLHHVQRLAVLVQDEKRAMRARKMRDEVRQEAEKALQEIQCIHEMSWSPDIAYREYRKHHQGTMLGVVLGLRSIREWEVKRWADTPDFLKHAAFEWHMKEGKVGVRNNEFRSNLRKARAAATMKLVPVWTPTPSPSPMPEESSNDKQTESGADAQEAFVQEVPAAGEADGNTKAESEYIEGCQEETEYNEGEQEEAVYCDGHQDETECCEGEREDAEYYNSEQYGAEYYEGDQQAEYYEEDQEWTENNEAGQVDGEWYEEGEQREGEDVPASDWDKRLNEMYPTGGWDEQWVVPGTMRQPKGPVPEDPHANDPRMSEGFLVERRRHSFVL